MWVTVRRAGSLPPAAQAAIRAAALAPLLRACGDRLRVAARAALTVRLTDDRELAELNARWMGVEGATDVLAFPAGDPHVVGDIAVSVERALAQSFDGAAELRLLAVHGLLHCLGHDHASPGEAATMTRLCRELLPGQEVPLLVGHQ